MSSPPIHSAQAQLDQAIALHRAGRLDQAVALYRRLLAQLPDSALVHRHLGIALYQQGQHEPAAHHLQRSIDAAPSVAALSALGATFRAQGRHAQALQVYGQALRLDPGNADVLNNRGNALLDLGRVDEAIESYGRAIDADPDRTDALQMRAEALRRAGRLADALADCDRALRIRPDDAVTHNRRGAILSALGERPEALRSFGRAILLAHRFALAHSNRGAVLLDLDRPAEGLAAIDRALAIDPEEADAHYNRGNALRDLDRLDEARQAYARALAIRPDFSAARWDEGLVALAQGDFGSGWPAYELRWSLPEGPRPRQFDAPRWRGEDLRGKTLLIWAEQGYGDAVQCCRYALLAQERGARVVLETRAPLVPLISTLRGPVTIVRAGDPLPRFDLHCPVMSLPLAFGTTLASIPAPVPYLYATAEKLAEWRSRLGARQRMRVGLAWSGSAGLKNDRRRSIRLDRWRPLLDLPIDFHCLQNDVREADARVLAAQPRIRTHMEHLHDFADAAALVECMDLVISVDTSIAHVAGAMGKTVWVLLPFTPDFRWLRGRSDSPWYPTATLFRQPRIGDWDAVLQAVAARLRQIAT